MPIEKAPAADLRRRYPLYAEAGLALALGAAVLAFTVPSPPTKAAPPAGPPEVLVELMAEVPVTTQAPPPPPPPAPPPPQEVPDDVPVSEVIETLELPLETVAVPPAPPVAPVVETPRAVPPPPPPPKPPVVDTAEPDVFDVAEVQPELVGGPAAIRPVYPELARRAGVEGTVVVQFVVDEQGRVVDPVVVRSPNDLLSDAALDAVRKVEFTPGQQRGRPVKVRFAVPVTFRLR